MGRTYKTQKLVEKRLIVEVLREMGFAVTRPQWRERPDAVVTVRKGGELRRVWIEHTAYFNDTVSGKCSPTSPIDELWAEVQASLKRRICKRGSLSAVQLSFAMSKTARIPNRHDHRNKLAKDLAAELVAFMLDNPAEVGVHRTFRNRGFEPNSLLKRFADSIRLSRWTTETVYASRCSWTCSNITTGGVGLLLSSLISAIEQKTKKAASYTWPMNSEKWLIIAAVGETVSNHAGPSKQQIDWDAEALASACRQSPFGKILFWERPRCWYKWLKPSRIVQQYRNPYVRYRSG